MKKLLTTIRDAGQDAVVLDDRVMVLPFGGRIIGLFPDGRHNILWRNAALDSPGSLRDFLSGGGWLNLGGDRTWISPEIDTNVGDPQDDKSYDVPKTVDPSDYRITASNETSVAMTTDMNVMFRRPGQTVPLSLTKRITSIKPDVSVPATVSACGYRLESTLVSCSPIPDGVLPGIWNILQVPGGGRMVIPVAKGTAPKTFMGQPAFDTHDSVIECEVDTDVSFKFGIHKDNTMRVMFYLNADAERASLIVRKFDVQKDAFYADVPCDDETALGYMQQFYVDDGALGGFGELEYHSPALGNGVSEIMDSSEVWGFSGPSQGISELLTALLADYSSE